jgi:hypothetical protein
MALLRLRSCVAISCWFARIKISSCRNAQRVTGYIYTRGNFDPGNILGLDWPGVRFAASGVPLVPGGSGTPETRVVVLR